MNGSLMPPERPFNVRAATPHRGDPETLLVQVDHGPRVEEMLWREATGLDMDFVHEWEARCAAEMEAER